MKNETKASPSEKILQDLLASALPVAEVLSATKAPAISSVRISSLDSLNKNPVAAPPEGAPAGLKIQDAAKAAARGVTAPGGGEDKDQRKVVSFPDRKKPADG